MLGSDEGAASVRDRLCELMPELGRSDNEHSLALLDSMITRRCLPHAVIIEGENIDCDAAAARLIARAYLCSCDVPLSGDCRACHLFSTYDTHPDMYVIEGSGSTGAVSVDSVREAKKRGGIAPTDAAGTVYLIERAELMQKQAQNAFLKLFEEPPEGLMLILTCSSRMKLLETIRSRGTIMHFEWPSSSEGSDAAEAEKTAAELAQALCAANDSDLLFGLAQFCSNSTRADGGNMRRQLDEVLEHMGGIFRLALLAASGCDCGPDVPPAVRELSTSVTPERLDNLIRELEPLRRALKNNASMPLLTAAITERLRRAAGR